MMSYEGVINTMEMLEETNKKSIEKSQLNILMDQNIWSEIYENFLNDYEEFDPDYEYEFQCQLEAYFNEYKDCFIWFILNCGESFPITIDDIKSNLSKTINFLDKSDSCYHDYYLEHDVYGILDYIIDEFRNYFEILTKEEYEELK